VIAKPIADALNNWDTIRVEDWIPDRLILLDQLRDRLAVGQFRGVDLLVIQHHLGTTVPLVRAFVEDGAPRDRIWHVDIPYSTNDQVHDSLLALTGDERCPPRFTDPLADYSAAQLMRVTTTLLDMQRNGTSRPLLVLDDGAYFLRAVTTLQAIGHPAVNFFRDSFVVEQTTRGHRLLQASQRTLLALGLRAVSIARTRTKTQFEGPFIGAAVAQSIGARAQSQSSFRPITKIAVLGFGVVGEACARALARRFPDAHLTIVDERTQPRISAERWLGEGHAHRTLSLDSGYDLLVGCTGRNSFTPGDRGLLADGAVLASGSSAAIEFDRAGFVDLADYRSDDEIEIVDREATRHFGIHADIALRLEGRRTVTFANAGFPVNFDGRVECLPIDMIQPTRCLMYAAATQVLAQQSAGVMELDSELDDWIYVNALRRLGI